MFIKKEKESIQKNNSKNYKIDYTIDPNKYKQKHYNYVKNNPENYKRIRLKYKRSDKGKLIINRFCVFHENAV
jgi:hypothetical protein